MADDPFFITEAISQRWDAGILIVKFLPCIEIDFEGIYIFPKFLKYKYNNPEFLKLRFCVTYSCHVDLSILDHRLKSKRSILHYYNEEL